MNKKYGIWALAFVAACVVAPKPLPPPEVPRQTLAVQLVERGTNTPIAGSVTMDEIPEPIDRETDGSGRVEFNLAPGPRGFVACAPKHDCDRIEGIDNSLLNGGSIVRLVTVALKSSRIDPAKFALSELAAIRGAMWPRATICSEDLRLPYGNRPGERSNIIATVYFDNYTSEQQEAIARCFHENGFTHVVMGGLVDWWAYHGQYSGHDYSTPEGFEKFLDLHEWFWDHGFKPVTFIHQDGATFEQTEAMVRRLMVGNARAQRLIRIVVMSGWEPAKYEWSSCTWANYVRLGREVLPNALNLIHTVSDVDAPVGTDALCNDDDHTWNPGGNGAGWGRVLAAGVDGWLIQNGPYRDAPGADPVRTREFAAQFKADGDGAALHSIGWHFAGNAGWQKSSICLYNAEVTAYEAYWYDRPDDAARAAWGNLAVQSGACGYLDGGSVAVPVR